MPACAVNWCKKSSKTSNLKRDGITFHIFPKNSIQSRKWAELCSRPLGWVPTYSSSICSRHFDESQFQPTLNNRRVLIKNAIPTLFLQRQELTIANSRGISPRSIIPRELSNMHISTISHQNIPGLLQNEDNTVSATTSDDDESELDNKTMAYLQMYVKELLPETTDKNAIYVIIVNNENPEKDIAQEKPAENINLSEDFVQDNTNTYEELKRSSSEDYLRKKVAHKSRLADERLRKIKALLKSRSRLLRKNAILTKIIVQLKAQNTDSQLKVDRRMGPMNSVLNGKESDGEQDFVTHEVKEEE